MAETRHYIGIEDRDDKLPRYPRPTVLEVIEANEELHRLDDLGELPLEVADQVRVLLAVVGRLSAGDMALAFPTGTTPAPVLRMVRPTDRDES